MPIHGSQLFLKSWTGFAELSTSQNPRDKPPASIWIKKTMLMDEMDMMPILCQWESVGAYFLAVVSEKLDRIYF